MKVSRDHAYNSRGKPWPLDHNKKPLTSKLDFFWPFARIIRESAYLGVAVITLVINSTNFYF